MALTLTRQNAAAQVTPNVRAANMFRAIAVVVGIFIAGSALACRSAPQYPPELVGKLATEASYVVETTLTSSTSETNGRFTVHKWLKGSGPSEIDISGFGYGTDCRSPMFKERSLIFLSRDSEEKYSLRETRTYAGVRPATKENIEAIMRAVSASTGRAQ
jgi:hypothetical protein